MGGITELSKVFAMANAKNTIVRVHCFYDGPFPVTSRSAASARFRRGAASHCRRPKSFQTRRTLKPWRRCLATRGGLLCSAEGDVPAHIQNRSRSCGPATRSVKTRPQIDRVTGSVVYGAINRRARRHGECWMWSAQCREPSARQIQATASLSGGALIHHTSR
jgi:hypothetical protein